MLVRGGVERFMEFDYVGAPWIRNPSNNFLLASSIPLLVGNGGLSLRSCRVMEKVCKDHAAESKELFSILPQQVPEDVFFSRFVYKDGYKVCGEEEAKEFATEQVINVNSVGFHKFWPYHMAPAVLEFFEEVLKMKMV